MRCSDFKQTWNRLSEAFAATNSLDGVLPSEMALVARHLIECDHCPKFVEKLLEEEKLTEEEMAADEILGRREGRRLLNKWKNDPERI